ncbi:MAG TPA: ABC transporter substrate-binding protein [Hydrogenophaga sp.]|uniref:ABC transporter substrate-binding protein n=1 Tax=Hydrogenophaga sp. TaxID=1904254 RepID=UPI002BA77CC8|nr:ABC transporter substrate-binding protein [Hydrogenophaga sp.]HMN91785.1 ABC transporter substrate-binding protein [Hydrogenophaga sp.]HMP10106.1 ABC transporter substrate-binding protein [Hydrogenophaga sp.]
MKLPRRRVLLAGLGAGALAARALGAQPRRETVRIAFIDPLSGPAADIGRNGLRSWQFMAERVGARFGASVPRILVAGFDNKASPRESVNMLRVAIDQGFRYIVQGNGSGVAAALSAAITRHNQQHPERSVLFINYAAMDPALTAERCSFWHFRIDADTAMKMRALVGFMSSMPDLRKVYLLNQNYAHGQQFSRYFREEVALQQPSMEIVGDELHPLFQGLDFRPYVQRMRESGAQALVTGNWGADMRGLIQALHVEDMRIPLFAYYPALKGTPTLLARNGDRMPVYQVAYNHGNQAGEVGELAVAFRARFGEDLVVYAAYDGIVMLTQAFVFTGSTDPRQVGARLSGMIFPGFSGPVQIRADDHQLQKGLYISRWQPVDQTHPRDAEGTGFTFVPVKYLSGADLATPVRCQMVRP